MHKKQNNIIKKDLVLLGAGHSNIEVIRFLGKKKINGLRITLITNNYYATYSGMVPGYIEGIYEWNDINIDLIELTYQNNIRIIIGEVVKILGKKKKIFIKNRPPLEFDILSVNLGIKSANSHIPGSKKNALFLKPVSLIKKTIDNILNSKSKDIVLVGAGAAGVEVILALSKRFKNLNIQKNLILISKNSTIMKTYKSSISEALKEELIKNNIKVIYDGKVTKITKNYLVINNKKKIYTRCAILSTHAEAPEILKTSDLELSSNGFVKVSNYLQTIKFKFIFASGDIADIKDSFVDKSGVYAVRQGNILKKSLMNFFLEKPLLNYSPQSTYLSIIGMTASRAIASKSFITVKGKLLWALKRYIDKSFIKKYKSSVSVTERNDITEKIEPSNYEMQCEGCGSKVARVVLENVFKENMARGSLDAERIKNTNNLVHTVDVITSIVEDFYLLGKIAAKHSLNDLFAANAMPLSAQMILAVSQSYSTIQSRDIMQIKEGAESILKDFKLPLSGGHTYSLEYDKMSVGFSMIGRKNNIKRINLFKNKKYKIYMTGKLGSALTISALRQNMISGKYYQEVLSEMTNSNLNIYKLFIKNNISAITDISGYGIATHLKNLLFRYENFLGANIYIDQILMLDGAKKALDQNVKSSLNEANKASLRHDISILSTKKKLMNILFDPQTAGGFLFITHTNQIIKDMKKYNIVFSQIGEVSNSHRKIKVY